MPDTFVKIASVTVGSGGAASIDFTSIPSTYTDLCLKVSLRSSRGAGANEDNPFLKFNGSATGYSAKRLYGNGANAFSANWTSGSIILGNCPASNATANTFGSIEVMIPNYAGSNNKSVNCDSVQENNITTAYAELIGGLWSDTTAISSMAITCGALFVQYSTATLYGIKNS